MLPVESRWIQRIEVYNLFDLSQRNVELLNHTPGMTVMDAAPKDIGTHWTAFIGADEITQDGWAEHIVPSDVSVVFIAVPGSGDSGKDALRFIAIIAVAFAAAYTGGLATSAAASAFGATTGTVVGASVTAGVQIAGSMIVNELLPATSARSNSSGFDEGASYGIDGPGNTAQQGALIPIIYGTFRTGGNIVEYVTENEDTRHQSLTMVMCLGEAPIESVSNIELNDQPIENYTGWSYQVKTSRGAAPNPIDWEQFVHSWRGSLPVGHPDRANRMVERDGVYTENSRGDTLTQDWTYHTTSATVDALRIDLLAPAGLYAVDSDGDYNASTVLLEIQYRTVGALDWRTAMPDATLNNDVEALYIYDIPYQEYSSPHEPYDTDTEFVLQDVPLEWRSATRLARNEYVEWDSDGLNGIVKRRFSPRRIVTYVISNPEVTAPEHTQTVGHAFRAGAADRPTLISGLSNDALRFSFRISPYIIGDESRYEVRIRRLTEQRYLGGSSSVVDLVVLQTIWEIETDKVGYKNLAMLALRVELNDQLNSIPSLTCEVKGRKLKVWDVNSYTDSASLNTFTVEHSANPAWIALDILTDKFVGADISMDYIDVPKWFEWAAFCEEKGLEFNGVFDFNSNIWDALQYVLRAGRAQIVRVGRTYSLAIARPELPVMMFGNGNIVEGTFASEWLSMEERANEIEVSYYDEEDGYRQHSIKVYDPDAFSEQQRTSTFSMMGVTSKDKAQEEAALALNMNRLLRQTCSFETGLDALGIVPGDVIHVQSDHPQWGYSGRLAAGSTEDELLLDGEVYMDSATTIYQVALIWPQYVLPHADGFTSPLLAVIGDDWIEVTTSPITLPDDVLPLGILIRGVHLRVLDQFPVVGRTDRHRFTVDRPPISIPDIAVGDIAEIYQSDKIITYTVAFAGETGAHNRLTINSAMHAPPKRGMLYQFGALNRVAKPFRVAKVSMGDDPYKRSIKATEYNASQYEPFVVDTGYPDYAIRRPPVGNVSALSIVTTYQLVEGGLQVTASLYWTPPTGTAYSGANVYLSKNGGPFEMHAAVGAQTRRIDLVTKVGAHVAFKVQARGDGLAIYPYSGSATISAVINSRGDIADTVTLPEEHLTGGSGDVWFSRHDPLENVIEPIIVDPPLAYVGAGAIRIHGKSLLHPDGVQRDLIQSGSDEGESLPYRFLDTPFIGLFQYRPFYVVFSDTDVRERFPDADLGMTSQFQFFISTFDLLNGQWRMLDVAQQFHPYEVEPTDLVVARGSKLYPYGGIDLLSSYLSTDVALPDYAAASSVQHFFQPEPPTLEEDDLHDRDVWLDTSDGNHMYRWNVDRWISARDAGISAALDEVFNAEQSLDQQVVLIFADSQPDGFSERHQVGNFWFNTSNSPRTISKWDGASWQDANSDLLGKACRTHTDDIDVSDGVVNLFLNNTEPSAENSDGGDLWFSGSTSDLSQYQEDSQTWIVVSTIGTLWDDIDGDGRPDDYVGNTGEQMLVDFNFQRAASGENTWQSFVKPNSLDISNPPLTYQQSELVNFETANGVGGSSNARVNGAGLSNYVHLRNPILFPASPGDLFVVSMNVITSQSVSASGYEGLGVYANFYDINFNWIAATDNGPSSQYGDVYNYTSNPNWNRQNVVLAAPGGTTTAVAFMTVTVVLRANSSDFVRISDVTCVRSPSSLSQMKLGFDGNHESYGLFTFPASGGRTFGGQQARLLGTYNQAFPRFTGLDIAPGEMMEVSIQGQVKVPNHDGYVTDEDGSSHYAEGTYHTYFYGKYSHEDGYLSFARGSVSTEEGVEFATLSATASAVVDSRIDSMDTNLILSNSETYPGLGFSGITWTFKELTVSVRRTEVVSNGFV